MVDALKVTLDEVDHLIFLERAVFGSDRGVSLDAFVEFIVDQVFGLFPPEFVGVLFADLFSFISEEVEETLEETGKFDYFEFLEIEEGLFKLI